MVGEQGIEPGEPKRTPAAASVGQAWVVFVVAVAGGFQLEGEVFDADREMFGDAGLELVEHLWCVAVLEAPVPTARRR